MKRAYWIPAALAILLFGALWARPKEQFRLYGFYNRAKAQPGMLRRIFPQSIPPPVITTHTDVSNYALLIRNIGIVRRPPWTFGDVIRRAFSVMGVQQHETEEIRVETMQSVIENNIVQTAADNLKAAWTSHKLEDAPFHLLAIVNRLDDAHATDGGMCGAEVRFVYEALHDDYNDGYLRLIVEFVMPCLTQKDFRDLANSWIQLSKPAVYQSGSYLDQLVSLLTAMITKNTMVRLRTISNGVKNWFADEFHFQVSGLQAVPLERQPNIVVANCQDAGSPLVDFATLHVKCILGSNFEYDANLACMRSARCSTGITKPDGDLTSRSVITLGSNVSFPDASRDDVRFGLSINTCASCHSDETNTGIFQIGPRDLEDTAASDLSGFLTGADDCTRSSTASLSYCIAPISHYGKPQDGSCSTVDDIKDRSFNDLLRRHLFLYQVLQQDPKADWQTWKAALDPFTSYQID